MICTVKATIFSPMPSRSAATRAGFISSAMTLTQPRITWSNASGANGWRAQQRPAALHGEIDGGERPGPRARLDERRPAAVDDENRSRHQLAALCSTQLLEELMHVGALLVNRRQCLGREIVDLDHLHRRRHARLSSFSPSACVMTPLFTAPSDVAHVRGMHSLARIVLGCRDQLESASPAAPRRDRHRHGTDPASGDRAPPTARA